MFRVRERTLLARGSVVEGCLDGFPTRNQVGRKLKGEATECIKWRRLDTVEKKKVKRSVGIVITRHGKTTRRIRNEKEKSQAKAVEPADVTFHKLIFSIYTSKQQSGVKSLSFSPAFFLNSVDQGSCAVCRECRLRFCSRCAAKNAPPSSRNGAPSQTTTTLNERMQTNELAQWRPFLPNKAKET